MTDYIPLGRSEKMPRSIWLAPLSVVLGSMTTLLPVVATVPLLPPFGLMMLLAWRLMRGDAMKVWMPVPLGFPDDRRTSAVPTTTTLLVHVAVMGVGGGFLHDCW